CSPRAAVSNPGRMGSSIPWKRRSGRHADRSSSGGAGMRSRIHPASSHGSPGIHARAAGGVGGGEGELPPRGKWCSRRGSWLFPPEGALLPPEGAFFPLEGAFSPLEGAFSPPEGAFFPPEGAFFPPEGAFFPLEGAFFLTRRRLGQGTFQLLTLDNYRRRCAVTGEKALPTLDAAHILPVKEGGQHRLDNGLLLRTDIHRLFDKGYVTVTPDGRFLVSRRPKDDFDNGEPYLPFHGQRIWVPGDPASQPNRMALEWHGDSRFLGLGSSLPIFVRRACGRATLDRLTPSQ